LLLTLNIEKNDPQKIQIIAKYTYM